MSQQTNQTTNSGEAPAALSAAEAEHATLKTRESEARAALEHAKSAVQNEGSAAAGKALLAAEDAVRIAAIAPARSAGA